MEDCGYRNLKLHFFVKDFDLTGHFFIFDDHLGYRFDRQFVEICGMSYLRFLRWMISSTAGKISAKLVIFCLPFLRNILCSWDSMDLFTWI
jgi:hypothetical protein